MPGPRQDRRGRRPTPMVRPQVPAAQLLDQLEQAMRTGDQTRVEQAVPQLWARRGEMAEAITQRLLTGQAEVPAFLFDLLIGFAGADAQPYFERIAAAPDVEDIVRFGARRRAGWPERGEAKRRLAFLAALHDGDATLVEAVAQGGEDWPPQAEILAEVLAYLQALPPERRLALLPRFARELGPGAALLLQGALHIDHAATQEFALRELVHLRPPGAAGAVARLARTTRRARTRTEAAAALQRLQMQAVDRPDAPAPEPLPLVRQAYLSVTDIVGAQVMMVTREWAPGVYLMLDVLWRDDWGIKDVFGSFQVQADELDEIVAGFADQETRLIPVDLPAVRGLIALALAANAATGHPLPPAYEVWEPLLHDTYPPAADEPVAVVELDDVPYAGRQDLVRQTKSLADHPDFATWRFDFSEYAPLLRHSPFARPPRLTDEQLRAFVEREFTPDERARWRHRLRRQAWLLDYQGTPRMRDLALATAAVMADAPLDDLAKLPFLRRLVDNSLQFPQSILDWGLR